MARHLDTTVKLDARDRALRTLYTSLGVDLLVAGGAVLTDWASTADLTSGAAWTLLGLTLGKTALTALGSYLVRLRVAPTA